MNACIAEVGAPPTKQTLRLIKIEVIGITVARGKIPINPYSGFPWGIKRIANVSVGGESPYL
jgi:hypothetical protein